MKSHYPDLPERGFLILTRFYHSLGYGMLYSLVLLVNFVLLVWLLATAGKPEPLDLFIGLEIGVTVALIGEIAFTSCVKTKSSAWFWFDVVVAVLCVISLVAYSIEDPEEEEVAAMSIVITSIRYVAQLLRASVMIRHFSTKTQPVEDLRLEEISWSVDESGEEEEEAKQEDDETLNFV